MGVKSYKDLQVWQKGIALALKIYQISSSFPKEELYGITSQIRRAAVSVPSNLAEGSSRRSTKEFVRFVNIASGSIAELETQMILCNNLGFISHSEYQLLEKDMAEIGKMLFALQRSLTQTFQSGNVTRLQTLDSGL